MTGHATHFLQRLDRLEREEIELALLLYNQPELLAQVLAHLRIPDDASRVALSFADGGPYLVVTRDGHFVTCLAKGMSTTNLFVVSHARLLVAADKVAEMRRRVDLAKSLAGEARWAESGIVPLYETLHVAPRAVSREVMMGLSPFAAILSKVMAASVDDEIQGLDGIEKRLATNLKRMGSLGREYADVSTKMLFHMIHQMVVVSMAELQRIRIEGIDGGGALVDMTVFAAPVPWLPLWSRAAYLLGKFGKEGLSALKRGYLESTYYADLVLFGAGLIVASLRHRRLATEIEKTLQRHVSPQQAGTPMYAMGNVVLSAFRAHHEGSLPLDHHREALFNRLVARMPAAHPDRPRAASDLPDHVVVAWLANTPGDLLGPDRLVLAMFFEMLGALADADALDLYLPAAYLPWLGDDESDDAYASRVIDTWRAHIGSGVPQPKTAPPTPGRNDPCSCGSGRKFKKCCGA